MADPADTFHIAFDTLSMPGKVLVTTVKLTEEIQTADAEFEARRFRVDLCDHPLYPRLVEYVRNNPRRRTG